METVEKIPDFNELDVKRVSFFSLKFLLVFFFSFFLSTIPASGLFLMKDWFKASIFLAADTHPHGCG
jgi:hypothetical protein